MAIAHCKYDEKQTLHRAKIEIMSDTPQPSNPHLKKIATELWLAGVNSVKGEFSVRRAMREDGLKDIHFLAAVGKAAESMYKGAAGSLADSAKTLLITKYGHSSVCESGNLKVMESGHPIPDANSIAAGGALLDFIESVPQSGTLVMLVSGGASSLAELLPENFYLRDLQNLTASLIENSRGIDEINFVRTRISKIKGGKAFINFKGKMLSVYAISDVADDDISVIGSGIGGRGVDGSEKTLRRIRMYEEKLKAVLGNLPVIPPPSSESFHFDYRSRIVASNQLARNNIARSAEDRGHTVIVNSGELNDNIERAAERISRHVLNGPAGVYIYGGETTVTLPKNHGAGGRNQHLALLLGSEISGTVNIAIIAAGTDGTDGPGVHAGAIIDGGTFNEYGRAAIEKADSGTFLDSRGALYTPGPTGTNVMDLVVAIKAE